MAKNTKYRMGFEHILFIFQCEIENIERKQMFTIRIFVTQHQAFVLKNVLRDIFLLLML